MVAEKKRPMSPVDMRIILGVSAFLFLVVVGISYLFVPGAAWKWGTIVVLAIYGYNSYDWTARSVRPCYGDEPIACVIGSGFSGLCAAVKLKREGIPFVVIEKNAAIGGTWRDNRYPGCACDIASPVYQFSFRLNPRWSCLTAPAEEINDYLVETAEHYDVVGNIRFNLSVVNAEWTGDRWRVRLSNGEEADFKYLISGCGCLAKPVLPDIPGANRFKGPHFHSARWDPSCDLAGKRVALVGSAASGMQVAQALVDRVEKLYVFQRTPNWYLPRFNPRIPGWMKTLLAAAPASARLMRWYFFLLFEALGVALFRKTRIARALRNVLRRHTEIQVDGDRELVEKLTPDFDVGCKRILFEDGYLAMYKDKGDTAKLVTDPIERVDEKGVVTAEKTYEVDVIVYATGFSIDGSIFGFPIRDRDGKEDIRDRFERDPSVYLGIAVPKFPNFFVLLGPNSILAHNTVVYMIECQVDYVTDCIKQMERHGIKAIDVKSSAMKRFADQVATWTENTPFAKIACNSWYKNKDGTSNLWPSNCFHYWWLTRTPNLLRDYVLTY